MIPLTRSELSQTHVFILGGGISGLAACKFLIEQGSQVTAFDDSEKGKQALQDLGAVVLPKIPSHTQMVVVSPGVPPSHPLYQQAMEKGIPIISEIELGSWFLKGKGIGITGTNGKTTVTQMLAHILNTETQVALAVGNVGLPLCSVIDEKVDIFVIEVSSYQLEKMFNPFFDVAVILNITPDHLDRYPSFEAYGKAKCHIENCLLPEGKLIISEQVASQFASHLSKPYSSFGFSESSSIFLRENTIYGHSSYTIPPSYGTKKCDLENLLAVYGVCEALGFEEQMDRVQSFQKGPHRIEWVATIEGVDYINDSKGTNVAATIKAVESFSSPIILIAGGVDKGGSYKDWNSSFLGKVKKVCLIGEAADKIERELQGIPVQKFSCLREGVKYARGLAKRGDVVLLSPGCSSFDQFANYKDRGDQFKHFVNELKG